jgi:DNA-directed RNA polymerase specialized sigma24 family protein
MIQEAAEDALLAYFSRPSEYDPQRSPLEPFLRLAALNNLRDAMRRIRRRLLHEICVGDDLPDRSASDPAGSYRWRDLRAVWRAAHTDTERAFLRARLRGERRVQGLADLLGVSGRPRADQRAEVNRVWTRLKLRIRRSLGKRERVKDEGR